ncbi:HAMP domain-containing histidine kinase [Patescibacteria group bacterium]|nr:HAMP domain-containing histidine kinase [Patescibacteria group bacterium]
MFRSARIKLTAWYLVIIMAVTVFFSSMVYFGFCNEAERALEMHERRLETKMRDFSRFQPLPERFHEPINQETIREIKAKLLVMLTSINLLVLSLAGAFGYILAGKTLEPIEEMIKRQKNFISDAAHELKTPLTSMKTYLEVNLRNKGLTLSQTKKILEETIEDVDSLTHLTNMLLTQSRYQNFEKPNNPSTFNLNTVIDKVIKKLRPKADEKGVEIACTGDNIEITANRENISELITILLDNGIKFNRENGKVSVILKDSDKYISIKVADTGIGIAKKDLPYIFDRFYKADTSRAKIEHDGFGLGLSIAREIVKTHGGNISVVESTKDGTIFEIKLPKK